MTPLSKVPTISITRCDSIKDITPIKNVISLRLDDCPFIESIDCLEKVEYLTIFFHSSIINFSALPKSTKLLKLVNITLTEEAIERLSNKEIDPYFKNMVANYHYEENLKALLKTKNWEVILY